MDAEKIFDRLERSGIYIVDKETLITYYENPVARKYSVKNRIGMPCYSIHGNTSMCKSCPIRSQEHTSYVNRADHNMIFVVHSEEIEWDGRPAYMISVKKQADMPHTTEDEKSMSRMSRALKNSVNVYTEINLETMRYRQINLKNAEHFSVSDEGDYAPAFEHMCCDEIHMDDVKNVRRWLSPDVLQKTGADSNGPKEVSVRYRLRNSSPVVLMESRAIFMRDELPHYVVVVAADITEETQLEEQKKVLSDVLENVAVGVFVFELMHDDVKIMIANPAICEMQGIDRDKAVGSGKSEIFALTHPEDVHIINGVVEALRKPGGSADYEYRSLNKKTGGYRWLSAKGRSVGQANGRVLAYVSYNDITERKKLEGVQADLRAEKAVNAAKSSFMSTMSHDMRTPLNAIINLAAIAHDDIGDIDKITSDLDKIEMSGSFLLGLINDVLDMSKIDSGKMTLQPSVYYSAEFANYVEGIVVPLCRDKDIRFIWHKDTTVPAIWVDKIRFNQVFFNLLSNAVKYTDAGGVVEFTVENDDIRDGTLFCDFIVSDTGIGMSREFQEKMFEPFEREDRASAYIGTGLGLPIAKHILDMMGGTIAVESELGVGTRITVHMALPIATPQQIAKTVKSTPELSGVPQLKGVKEGRVLVVEDHPLNREIIQRLLAKGGYSYDSVDNGKAALDAVAACEPWHYRAILMDIRMPVMDGLTAAREIRALDSVYAKSVPIIALTANAYAEDAQKSRDAGMNAHLSKPINPDKLYETLAMFTRQA